MVYPAEILDHLGKSLRERFKICYVCSVRGVTQHLVSKVPVPYVSDRLILTDKTLPRHPIPSIREQNHHVVYPRGPGLRFWRQLRRKPKQTSVLGLWRRLHRFGH